MGFNQIYDYVRSERSQGHVGELGYGVIQRGGAVHPDNAVKKELHKLAQTAKKEKDWTEFNRHYEGLHGPRDPPVSQTPEMQLAIKLHALRKRQRQVRKFRYFRHKKGKKWRRRRAYRDY